jgi:hypothetical protein
MHSMGADQPMRKGPMKDEERRSSLEDETPGSQGEVEAGSEGDFGGTDEADEEDQREDEAPPT